MHSGKDCTSLLICTPLGIRSMPTQYECIPRSLFVGEEGSKWLLAQRAVSRHKRETMAENTSTSSSRSLRACSCQCTPRAPRRRAHNRNQGGDNLQDAITHQQSQKRSCFSSPSPQMLHSCGYEAIIVSKRASPQAQQSKGRTRHSICEPGRLGPMQRARERTFGLGPVIKQRNKMRKSTNLTVHTGPVISADDFGQRCRHLDAAWMSCVTVIGYRTKSETCFFAHPLRTIRM